MAELTEYQKYILSTFPKIRDAVDYWLNMSYDLKSLENKLQKLENKTKDTVVLAINKYNKFLRKNLMNEIDLTRELFENGKIELVPETKNECTIIYPFYYSDDNSNLFFQQIRHSVNKWIKESSSNDIDRRILYLTNTNTTIQNNEIHKALKNSIQVHENPPQFTLKKIKENVSFIGNKFNLKIILDDLNSYNQKYEQNRQHIFTIKHQYRRAVTHYIFETDKNKSPQQLFDNITSETIKEKYKDFKKNTYSRFKHRTHQNNLSGNKMTCSITEDAPELNQSSKADKYTCCLIIPIPKKYSSNSLKQIIKYKANEIFFNTQKATPNKILKKLIEWNEKYKLLVNTTQKSTKENNKILKGIIRELYTEPEKEIQFYQYKNKIDDPSKYEVLCFYEIREAVQDWLINTISTDEYKERKIRLEKNINNRKQLNIILQEVIAGKIGINFDKINFSLPDNIQIKIKYDEENKCNIIVPKYNENLFIGWT